MLETSHLAPKYTSICSFRKYTVQCLGPLNFADVSIFLQKNSVFYLKKYLYSKQYCENCVRDLLVLFSVFVRQKVTVNENVHFTDYASGIRVPDCSKLVMHPKTGNDSAICWCDVIAFFFFFFFDVVLFYRYGNFPL